MKASFKSIFCKVVSTDAGEPILDETDHGMVQSFLDQGYQLVGESLLERRRITSGRITQYIHYTFVPPHTNRWEYRVEIVDENSSRIQSHLNELGNLGWELVESEGIHTDTYSKRALTLKRKKSVGE